MQWHDRMPHEEFSHFVGRSKELDIMHNHTVERGRWQWLHIYGPSGIGKSALIKQFKSMNLDLPLHVLDGSKGMQQQEETLQLLTRQIEQNNELTSIILLVDSFDQWGSADYWFAQWLGKLNSAVRIITAGQNDLSGGWLRSGWASLIQTMQLPSLTPIEVECYAQKRGMTDFAASSQLYRFSRGIPLAMMLAAEVLLRGSGNIQFDHNQQSHLTSVLMNELIKNMPSSTHLLLEAASVYWRFNEERLAAIIEDGITTESFWQFVALSLVISREDGWTLHDAVRAWVLEDFIHRKPQTYERMRQKALEQVFMEERLLPHLRHNLYLDKFSLHENPIVRTVCFSGHLDNLELRECQEDDLPMIQSLYVRYHHHAVPKLKEVPLMEQLMGPIWKVAPSSFVTVSRDDSIIAVYGKIPLTPETLNVFAKEPLMQPLIEQYKPIPNAFLLSFIGIIPDLAESTRAYIMNTILRHFHPSEWIIAMTPLIEWFPVFELVGFERAIWADIITPEEITYRAFVLDLRKEDFLTKLNRKLSPSSSKVAVKRGEEKGHINELKKLLKHWSRLPHRPDLVQIYRQLFPRRLIETGTNEALGLHIQEELLLAIQLLIEGDEMDTVLGTLLNSAYIHDNQPHEQVAKQLNLSMATYYRYLNKALRHLYLLLISRNIGHK